MSKMTHNYHISRFTICFGWYLNINLGIIIFLETLYYRAATGTESQNLGNDCDHYRRYRVCTSVSRMMVIINLLSTFFQGVRAKRFCFPFRARFSFYTRERARRRESDFDPTKKIHHKTPRGFAGYCFWAFHIRVRSCENHSRRVH